MKRLILTAMIAVSFFSVSIPARAQEGGYLECMACKMVLGLVESSAGDDPDITVDASKQCSLLPPGDREACGKFYSTMGPKFIKALRARRAKGESLENICRTMDYCVQ
jgi:hypothetical protein